MRIRPRNIAVLAALLVLLAGISAGPAAAQQVLPHHLKAVHCSRLADLHGVAKSKHYLRDLTETDHTLYVRMYNTISGETGGTWYARAHNASGASGLAQFMPEWWNGYGSNGWRWDPYNATLNIRVFYYVVKHPASTGGWSNWSGH